MLSAQTRLYLEKKLRYDQAQIGTSLKYGMESVRLTKLKVRYSMYTRIIERHEPASWKQPWLIFVQNNLLR